MKKVRMRRNGRGEAEQTLWLEDVDFVTDSKSDCKCAKPKVVGRDRRCK